MPFMVESVLSYVNIQTFEVDIFYISFNMYSLSNCSSHVTASSSWGSRSNMCTCHLLVSKHVYLVNKYFNRRTK